MIEAQFAITPRRPDGFAAVVAFCRQGLTVPPAVLGDRHRAGKKREASAEARRAPAMISPDAFRGAARCPGLVERVDLGPDYRRGPAECCVGRARRRAPRPTTPSRAASAIRDVPRRSRERSLLARTLASRSHVCQRFRAVVRRKAAARILREEYAVAHSPVLPLSVMLSARRPGTRLDLRVAKFTTGSNQPVYLGSRMIPVEQPLSPHFRRYT